MSKGVCKIAVIFDMDGVLIDTVGLHWEAYNSVLTEDYGVFVKDTMLGSLIGMSLSEQIPVLEESFNIQIDQENFINKANTKKELMMDNIRPKEGVVKLLKELSRYKIPIGLGTSTSRFIAEKRMKYIGIYKYFDTILGEEDVTQHKPSPEIYDKVALKLKVKNDICIVIEDAPNGLKAAVNAKMLSIGVVTRFVDKPRLSIADLVVSSLKQLSVKKLENLYKKIRE